MDQCNIIICTPGRLLQHMDENPLFDCINMQVNKYKNINIKVIKYIKIYVI